MTTKNNSMQLRRFSNTMDLHSNRSTSFFEGSSELVKLPALRAINKSVKYNDLSYATTRDMKKLHKEPEEPQNIQQISAHHSLLTIRKKYDNMNKQRQQLQRQVSNLQKQTEKLQSEKNRFQNDKISGNTTIGDSGNGLQVIKTKLQEAEIQKKIMINLISRHKADKIVFDQRKYNMQKDFIQLTKNIDMINKQYLKQKSENENTQKFKNKYLSHLQAEQQERNDHMNIIQTRLEQKTLLLQNNQKRVQELQEISQLALQDKDYKQKSWYKVYLCHRFVQKLLRDKMNREMFKFNTVQVAFKNIKTTTGVNSADSLIQKYLNKETAYGQLLGKIAQNQKSINDLKYETEQLKKERRELQIQQQTLTANKRELKDLSKEQKQFQEMGLKSKICQSYNQRLRNWLQRTLQKFKIGQKDSVDLKQNDLMSYFKHYHKTIVDSLQNITQIDEKEKIGEVIHENNYRITFEENPENQEKKKLKTKTINQNEQQDYVNNQRQQLIKNNDKYMKQLRKKYEDLKKAQIEAQPKKKDIIVEKPKLPPVQA